MKSNAGHPPILGPGKSQIRPPIFPRFPNNGVKILHEKQLRNQPKGDRSGFDGHCRGEV